MSLVSLLSYYRNGGILIIPKEFIRISKFVFSFFIKNFLKIGF